MPPLRRLSGLVSHLLSHGTRLSAISQEEFRAALDLYIEIARSCHGGFSYRMARATYYYEALQTRLKDIRSHPIQGWQSYPGFITRHFDQRFRSMRSTGERYKEIGARIERLYALYGSERQRVTGYVTVVISALGAASAAAAFVLYSFAQRSDWLAFNLAGITYLIVLAVIASSIIYPRMISVEKRLAHPHTRFLPFILWFLIIAATMTACAFVIFDFLAAAGAPDSGAIGTPFFERVIQYIKELAIVWRWIPPP